MSIVAIIPARSGSKRIPKKNIKLFAGKPIIAYSIESAKESKLFNRIVVSTDSQEIAKVAERFGAEIPFLRPAELADDHTGVNEVVLHALNYLLEDGENIDFVCCIYATAPFIRPEYIKRGYDLLLKKGVTSTLAVTSFSYPIKRALKINELGKIELFWPNFFESRSQDIDDAFHDAGQFCWAYTKLFLKEKRLLTQDSFPLILPRYLVQDIDTLEDWKRAELMFKAMHSNN